MPSSLAHPLQILMYAQLRDNNQGIVKITSGGLNKHPKCSAPVIEKSTRWDDLQPFPLQLHWTHEVLKLQHSSMPETDAHAHLCVHAGCQH